MIPGLLLIRADASVAIGTGHVMRCLALAQAWQDSGGRAVFAMAAAGPSIEERLRAESCEVFCISAQPGTAEDVRETIQCAQEQKADWVVVDGYQFGAEYQRSLKTAGFKVLFADDDGHAQHYFVDLVLNQNVGADEALYQNHERHTRLLLGTRYCMLRREFGAWREWRREIPTLGRHVLVTMGGSDPQNLSQLVIEALRGLDDIEVIVIVGGSNPRFGDLRRTTSQFGGWLRLRNDVPNMAELMAWADVLVAAAGSTCWEACLLQLPMVLVDVADNQKLIAQGLDSRGAAIHLGTAGDVTEKEVANRVKSLLASTTERTALSEACGKLVDGWGAARVFCELTRS
jgi:UDP-2,4-diacetamido-2,4,6-trideoxy-beta-L-altropyranose hydrolase